MRDNEYVSGMLERDGGEEVPSFFDDGTLDRRETDDDLDEDGRHLLKTASAGNGYIHVTYFLNGTEVSVDGKDFTEGRESRTIARMEAAVRELQLRGLIEDRSGKGEVFEVTHAGYHVADALPADGLGPANS